MTNEFDIIEHPFVFSWLNDYLKKEPLGLVFLTQGNSDYFNRIWGENDGKSQNYLYWKKDYLGIIIYVYSNEKETNYKVQYLGSKEMFKNDEKTGTYLTGFLSKFIEDTLEK